MSSKSKRSKKRKRQAPKPPQASAAAVADDSAPQPEALSHILVGLSSITRHLQTLSRSSRPEVTGQSVDDTPPLMPHIAAIFVCRPSQPTIIHSHLPQLVVTASAAYPDRPPTRLIELPKGCETRLNTSLGLPRAGFVAIFESCSHSASLLDFVRSDVAAIELDWLKEVRKAEYKPIRIKVSGDDAAV